MFILKGIKNFLSDLYHNRIAILCIIIYMSVTQYLFHSVCPIAILFGFPCPACGLTRAGISFQLLFRWTPASFFWSHTFFIFGFINIYSKKSRLIWRSSLVCSVSLSLAFIFYACSHIRSLNFQQTA
mgnify:CR=1 FL=1